MTPRSSASLLLLLIGCAPAPTPKKEEPPVSPAEIFRRMEQQLVDSTSLKIRARCDQVNRSESGTEERRGLTATLLLRGDTQFAIELQGIDRDGSSVGASLVSDGTRMVSRPRFSDPWVETDIPNSFRVVFLSLMHRIGLVRTTTGIATMVGMKTFLLPAGVKAAANFRSEETKDGVACLSYTIVDLTGRELHAKLWYDAETLRPVRRTTGFEDGKPGATYEERYEDYVPDKSIGSAAFVLPDPDPTTPRRWTHDGDVLIYEEREGPKIRFVLICSGVDVGTTDKGVVIKHGGVTQNLAGNTGLMLVTAKRTTMNSIPEGWDHDLVQEYLEDRAAHPGTRIRDWLAETLKRRPAKDLQELYGK